jgi:hypothetical protein
MTDYKPEYDILRFPCSVAVHGELFDWDLWSAYYPDAVAREVWRQIPGFSRYIISNIGRVRDISSDGDFVSPKLYANFRDQMRTIVNDSIKTVSRDFGEFRYLLAADSGENVWRHIHTLVALAFVPLPRKYVGQDPRTLLVRRRNRLSSDFRASNLSWVSAHELWAEQQHEFMERSGSSKPGYGFHYKALSASIMEHMRATFGGFGKVALEPVSENAELLASDDPQCPIWTYVPSG